MSKVLNDVVDLYKLESLIYSLDENSYYFQDFMELDDKFYYFFDTQINNGIDLFIKDFNTKKDHFDTAIQNVLLISIKDIQSDGYYKFKFILRLLNKKKLSNPSTSLLPIINKLIEYYENEKTLIKEDVLIFFEMIIDLIIEKPQEQLIKPLTKICYMFPSDEGDWQGSYSHILKSISLLVRIKHDSVKNILLTLSKSKIDEVAKDAKFYLKNTFLDERSL